MNGVKDRKTERQQKPLSQLGNSDINFEICPIRFLFRLDNAYFWERGDEKWNVFIWQQKT